MATSEPKPRRTTRARRSADNLERRAFDAAMAIAEESAWEHVRMADVAARLKVSLADLRKHYRDRDAIADAWFDRAAQAMLAPPPRGFSALPADERIFTIMMRWFDSLAPHQRVTRQMLTAKLYPAHPHHWLPMVFNLSHTIQWIREAARLDATGRQRQMEEIGLTGLFLATLAVWLRDTMPEQERTRRVLRRRLAGSGRLMARIWQQDRPAAA